MADEASLIWGGGGNNGGKKPHPDRLHCHANANANFTTSAVACEGARRPLYVPQRLCLPIKSQIECLISPTVASAS